MTPQSCVSLQELEDVLTNVQNRKLLRELIDEKEDCIGSYSCASLLRQITQRPGIGMLRKSLYETITPFVDGFLKRSSTTPVFIRNARVNDDLPPTAKAVYRTENNFSMVQPRRTIIVGKDFCGYQPEEVLSHEYAHHHQEECEFFTGLKMQSTPERFVSHTFKEGHAVGVEFAALRALIQPKLPLVEAEQLVYLYPAARLLENMKLNHQKFTSDSNSEPSLLLHEHTYILGHALFAIAELKHGPSIYAESLRNPRVVLE